MFHLQPPRAVISDINPELINCYTVIRDDLNSLMESLSSHVNTLQYFYDIRGKDTSTLSKVERASRFIYLNRTCFNGLHRENSKGQFNSAYGNYKNPLILDKDNLTAVNRFLNDRDITINCCGYQETVKDAVSGDFVFFDPPYVPLTQSANFTSYTKHKFGMAEQKQLAEKYHALSEAGVFAMETNSNTDIVRELYTGFNITTVLAKRNIAVNAAVRGRAANEVLIKNYEINRMSRLF